jgi:hypothetical protein
MNIIPLLKKIIFVFVFLVAQYLGQAQTMEIEKPSTFSAGIETGLNYSKFYAGDSTLDYAAMPMLGFYTKWKMSDFLELKSGFAYSIKRSRSRSPYFKLNADYFDLYFMPRFTIHHEVWIGAGLSFSALVDSKIIFLDGQEPSGVMSRKADLLGSECNYMIGVGFKMFDNLDFEFNYIVPSKEKNTKNFQFLLNFTLFNKQETPESYKQIVKRRSKEQILQLRNGVLLVRLKTSENKIKALQKVHRSELAIEIGKQQKMENEKIVAAFRDEFDFCQVEFFYSNNSKKILAKEYGPIFLDDQLNIDPSIKFDTTKPVFIAEFGRIEQDTTKYFSHFSNEEDTVGVRRRVKNYYGGPNLRVCALIILDDNFVQLHRPFPFYSRRFIVKQSHNPNQPDESFLPIRLTFDKVVERMNKKLTKYYKKNY